MKKWIYLPVLPGLVSVSSAVVVNIPASKDATLYESATGNLANGAGDYIFAGRTLQAGGSLRRALIEFDVAAAVPAGATINSASLTLHASLSRSASTVISLHRMNREWSEGLTDAPGQEGGGGSPVAGSDATWLHASSPSALWSSPGATGDFNVAATSSQTISVLNAFYTWTGLAGDVQAWLTDDGTNHGWLLHGNESTQATAVQFDSRSNFEGDHRPVLRVDFTAVPEPSIAAVAAGLILSGMRRRRVQ